MHWMPTKIEHTRFFCGRLRRIRITWWLFFWLCLKHMIMKCIPLRLEVSNTRLTRRPFRWFWLEWASLHQHGTGFSSYTLWTCQGPLQAHHIHDRSEHTFSNHFHSRSFDLFRTHTCPPVRFRLGRFILKQALPSGPLGGRAKSAVGLGPFISKGRHSIAWLPPGFAFR